MSAFAIHQTTREESKSPPPLRQTLSTPADEKTADEYRAQLDPIDELTDHLGQMVFASGVNDPKPPSKDKRRSYSEGSAGITYKPPGKFVKISSDKLRLVKSPTHPQAKTKPSTPVTGDFDISEFLGEGFLYGVGFEILAGFINRFGVKNIRCLSRSFYNAIEALSNHCIVVLSQKTLEPVRELFFSEPFTHILDETYKGEKSFKKCQVITGRLQRVFEFLEIPFNLDDFFLCEGNIGKVYNIAYERVISFNIYAFELVQLRIPQAILATHGIDLEALNALNPFETMVILHELMQEEQEFFVYPSHRAARNLGLTYLPTPFFDHARNSHSITLCGNKLTELPSKLGGLANLTSISASCNNLSRISREVLNHPSLKTLFIPGNNNLVFDRYTPLPPNLTTLDAEDATFKSLPIALLTKLVDNPEFDFFFSREKLTEHARFQVMLIKIMHFLEQDGNVLRKYPNIDLFYRKVTKGLTLEQLLDKDKPGEFCHRFYRALTYELSASLIPPSFERFEKYVGLNLERIHESEKERNAIAMRSFLQAAASCNATVRSLVDLDSVADSTNDDLIKWSNNIFDATPGLSEALSKMEVLRVGGCKTLEFPVEVINHCTSLKLIVVAPTVIIKIPRWFKKRQKWTVVEKLGHASYTPRIFYNRYSMDFDSTVHLSDNEIRNLLHRKERIARG